MADEPDAADAREEAARSRLERMREAMQKVDSHPAVVTAVEKLRKRAPGDAKFGDRLSTSEPTPSSVVARGVSAMEPDRPSALLEFGMGALQVWQSLAESAGKGKGERDVTIVFTDLVGFSSWALRAGDEVALDLLRAVGDAVEDAFFAHGGRIVKRLGDGVMAVFDDPHDALEATLDAQEALGQVEVAGYRPKMRAGLHHGRPRKVGGDYLGVDVNIAARVAEQAKGGEVLISQSTWDLVEKPELRVSRARRLRASGTPKDMRVRAVSRAG